MAAMKDDPQKNEVERFLVDGLVKVVEAHAARTGTLLSSVGRYAVADGRLFERLEAGGSLTVRQWGRVLQWVFDRWPVTEPWPADVVRPAKRYPVPTRKMGRPSAKLHGVLPPSR